MKIESIHIRNVRGLQDANIQLGMVPNKPSLLVAPNGSGKSSFAIAFQSLQKNKISVPENDVYNNDLSRRTSLEIKTDDGKSYIANEEKNEIQKEFSVFVINSKNKPKASIRNINGTRVPSVKMTVDPIILVNKIPKDVKLDYSLQKEKCIDNVVSGTIPSVKDLLNNNRFISSFETADLQNVKRSVKVIEEFVARLKKYDGTKKAVWEMVEKNDLSVLKDLPILSCRIEQVKSIFPEDNDVQLYLKTIQLVFAYLANPKKFKEKIEFARYKIEYDSYIALFGSLKETWKGIKPKTQGDKLIVEIPDSTALSNGERDIIVFLAMLERAKNVLNKKQNILIIDEIFDYLDDANYTAAYYYILEFIYKLQREDKIIYPIIMSHLNPDFFDHFPKDSLRVYYLNPQSVPTSSENILKVLRVRESKLGQGDDYISKYMLHFYDPYDDSINECLKNELKIWQGKILNFKNSCKKQMDAYLKGESTYDAVAVCIWLRECIERYVYDRLNVELRKQFFDGPQAEGTRSKLIFAERHDVSYPKSFSILAPIYNDPLHIGKSGETKDLRQTLFSRLHNNTIRGMIEKIANGIELEF